MSLTDYHPCAWCGLPVDPELALQMHPGCLRSANIGTDPLCEALTPSVVEKKGR